MAVYAPGDNDPDVSQPTADPGMFARIQQYLSGLNPIGSANASVLHPDLSNPLHPDLSNPKLNATLQANPNPLNNPSRVDPRLAGGGPPVPPSLTGPPPAPPPIPIVPGGGSSGGGGASAGWFPGGGNTPMPWNGPPGGGPAWFHPSNTPMPWNGPNAPLPPPRPGGAVAGGGGAQVPGSATAQVPPVAAGPGFGVIDRQNASAQQGQPGRGYQTALDLSRMFGMPSDVNPGASATPRPVSGGVLSKAGTKGLSKVDPDMGPFTAGQRSARGLKQRYG